MSDDDDFDPVEFIRQRRSQDEAWSVLAAKVERVKDQAASPLANGYEPLRVTLGGHVRISPAARAAFGLKPLPIAVDGHIGHDPGRK